MASWTEHHTSRRWFDLTLRLVNNGVLDEARGPFASNSTFWDLFRGLAENRPERVPEILAHRIRRRFSVLHADGENLHGRELLGHDHAGWEMVRMAAERAPAAFVTHLLPVVLAVSDSTVSTNDKPPRRDVVWPILFRTDHPSGTDACLAGLARALSALARDDASNLRGVIDDLRGRDTHVANHLLLALYAGGAANLADEAVSLLCNEPWRFECGFSDSSHWCAMETIGAVAARCAPEDLKRLEETILGYVSPYERTKRGYKAHGWARFDLLPAIPAELRSDVANRHVRELERKFGKPTGEPQGIMAGIVRSPIEKRAANRMTDGQWLRAVRKYHSEDRIRQWDDPLKGGARELSGVWSERVKEDPERFARLALQFPADTNPVYLERTLSALKDAGIASDLKLQICRKAFGESVATCGCAIADVLGGIEDPLPDDAVEMLQRLATEHEDPSTEAWRAGYYGGDVHTCGINTTRGRAAYAIRGLVVDDAAYVGRFRPTLERMIRDPSAAVRCCVAAGLGAVAWRDPEIGMSLFLRMNLSDDRLLATHPVSEFIRVHLCRAFPVLRPTVERMLRSSDPDVHEAGARLASIGALSHESAADLVDEAMRGSARQRLGVAQVAAANLGVSQFRAWSEARLRTLFDDDDAAVRRKAAGCFRHVEEEALDEYETLIEAFCDSGAFRENSGSLLYVLKNSRRQLPGSTCLVCGKFLERFADEARDYRTHRAADAYFVPPLVFRTYQQHQDDEWTSRALDLIDHLCLEGIHAVEAEFEQFER